MSTALQLQFVDNCHNKVQKLTISQIELTMVQVN